MVASNQATYFGDNMPQTGMLDQGAIGHRQLRGSLATRSGLSNEIEATKTAPDFSRDDMATLAIARKIVDSRSERERRFKRLVSEWKQQRNGYSSDPIELAMCPAYQKIIGMGPEAITLVLNELSRRPDHWFWALSMLTDADPIRAEHAGDFKEMVKDWIGWGREHGYLWD